MDTIVAIITPAGVGAVHIIRLSGKSAHTIAAELILGLNTDKGQAQKLQLRKLAFKDIGDDILCSLFFNPKSYTGEDVAEINTHGSEYLARMVVNQAIKLGARAANAGEFTMRAFLNGKIDLTQAEGIADIISAQSSAQVNAAYKLSGGELYKKIVENYERLITLAAESLAACDYPEEDIEEQTAAVVKKECKLVLENLKLLESSYTGGRIIRDGVRVAIVGRPNVGKSSLLNSLIGFNRAIVTSVAGTTRDTIEESYIYKGIKFVFIDTAGIRESSDEVEKIGISLSHQAAEAADIIISVTDDKPYLINLDKPIIYVLNKCDIKEGNLDRHIKISAKENINIDNLKEKIYSYIKDSISGEGVRLTTARQISGVKETIDLLNEVILEKSYCTIDVIASLITEAANSLGKLCGKTASEGVIDEIFSKFCVGK